MKTGISPDLSKKESVATKADESLQMSLSLKCANLFRDAEPNEEAEPVLFEFLNSLSSFECLNFHEAIKTDLHAKATPLEMIALYSSMINARCLELVFDKIKIQSSDLNRICQGMIFIKGTTLMHLVLLSSLNVTKEEVLTGKHLKCLELIFQNASLYKKINYNLKCQEGPYRGTSILWLLCLLVLRRNKKEYLDKLFHERKIREKLNLQAVCERDHDKHVLNNMLSMLNPNASNFYLMAAALCASFTVNSEKMLTSQELEAVIASIQRAPLESDDPIAGLGIPHLLADIAAQGHPTYLHHYLNTQKPNAQTLNSEILAGSLRGISLFYIIAFAELTTGESFVDKIPLSTLLEVNLNKKMGGEMNPGLTPFYWLAALVSKGRVAPFERIMAKYSRPLDYRIMGQSKTYNNISILWWLTFAAAKGYSGPLVKLLQAKNPPFLLEDFVRKTQLPNNETSPLYWMIRTAMMGHTLPLDLFFKKYPIQKVDFNTQIINEVSKGTTLLWWIAYAALLGTPQYLDRILEVCPLERLALHAKCETSESYSGWTVLQLMAEAMYKRQGNAFWKVLNHTPHLSLDLFEKQISGKNLGLMAFHQITQMTVDGHDTCLRFVLQEERFKEFSEHLNDKLERGPNKGVTPAWWLAAAALLQKMDVFSLLPEHALANIDFNAFPEKKENSGISVFALLARACLQRNTRPLALVLEKVDLNKIEFNIPSQEAGQLGTTPLWWLAVLAATEYPQYLETVLTRVPFTSLNFDAKCLGGEYEGTTPLWWIVKAAMMGDDKCLKIFLAKANILSYDLQAKLESATSSDHSVILGLASLGYCDIVASYLYTYPINEIDFNSAFSWGKFAGTTLLWWIAAFAALKEERLLEKVLNEVPLAVLDFTATNCVIEKDIPTLLAGTRWEKILPFFMLLKKAQENSFSKEEIVSLNELELAAATAVEAGFLEANEHLGRYCVQRVEHEIGSRLMLTAAASSSDSDEVSSALASSSQNKDTSSLDDLCHTLSAIKLCPPDILAPLSPSPRVLTFSTPLANNKMSPLVVEAKLVSKPRFRSDDASAIHSLVMRICRAKAETSIFLFEKLEKFLQVCSMAALTELSINGFSHLDDTHLVFAQSEEKLRESIAIHLLRILKTAMASRLKKETIASLLCNKPAKGPILFHMAIKTRSLLFLKEVIAMHKVYLSMPVWQKVLSSIGLSENHRLLAIIKNEANFSCTLVEEVREAFGEENSTLLQKCSKVGRKSNAQLAALCSV